MHSRAFSAPTSILLFSALLLSGCGMGITGGGSTSNAVLSGRVMGGQQPITGSTIQLYAATGTSYGAPSDPRISSTVMSDSNGSFSISHDYTCPSASAQVYIVASGGNPGLLPSTINNTAITLMAALGNCGDLSTSTHIVLNEVTTVAAAWALAPFMTSFDHVGATTTNAVGLKNAFAMANVLAASSTGQSPGYAPAGSVVPSNELNSLANILASCVNTAGGSAGDDNACGHLFTDATPGSGVVSGLRSAARGPTPKAPSPGTPPTNTADAALDIALNPSNSVGAIFLLADPAGPFQSTLSAAPNDWTVAVNFNVGTPSSKDIAFDSAGNLWVAAADALYELSPQGTSLGAFPAMAGNKVALDATGNIWVSSGSSLIEMPPTLGTPVTHAATNTGGSPNDGLAIDGFGNAWYTCDTCANLYELGPSGTPHVPPSFPVLGGGILTNIAVDPNEDISVGNFSYTNMNVLGNNGTPLSNSPLGCGACGHPAFVAYDGGGIAWIVGNDLTRLNISTGSFTNFDTPTGGIISPAAVAIDGLGNAWVANATQNGGTEAGSISEFSNGGTAVTSTAYVSDTLDTPLSIAVDGSGNVWVRNTGSSTVTAFVGAAVPTVTPLALGIQNHTLGSKP